MNFDEIPLDWLEPSVLMEIKPNYSSTGVLPYPTKVCIVGQKLAAGTLAPGQVVEIVRPEEAIAYFGLGSIGAEQVAAFRKANSTTPLFVTALADAGGAVKSIGTVTFAGAMPAQPSVLRFKIAGFSLRITALPADTVTTLATKLVAAITAATGICVTAAAALGVVTITSRHGGEVGNDIDIRVDTRASVVPAGLTITVVAMSGGAGNPVLQTALDTLTNTWFTMVQHPWSDATNMVAFAEWLRVRYLATSKLDAHGFVAKRGTYGELGTFGALTNSPFISCMGLKASPTSSWALSAAVCGLAAFHLTNDPARQLKSLIVPGVDAPEPADQFQDTEQDLLLRTGISTFNHLADFSTTISRVITTYKTSALGIPDRAWLDIMVPLTMSRIRYDWSAYVSLQYPRAKLIDDESAAGLVPTDDSADAGAAIVTPKRMHASWGARSRLYAQRVWIESVDQTIKDSKFERADSDKNRLNARQKVNIVGNLMTFASSLEFQV